jgi:flavorubredoxin
MLKDLTPDEMEFGKALYDDGTHKFIWLGWSYKKGGEVQTNQYLIISRDKGILLDPGGIINFPHVNSIVASYISPEKVEVIIYSHQDPDVSSGIGLALSTYKNAKAYVSRLWMRFAPHFGIDREDLRRMLPVEDRGTRINIPTGYLELIPAHFLHSAGNFSVYDPQSKILFSGDIGASVMPDDNFYFEVKDFRSHIRYMEGFHKRYMKSQVATRKWVSMVRRLKVDIIAPQHGAIMRGKVAEEFLSWLENLRCGVDLIDEIYGG